MRLILFIMPLALACGSASRADLRTTGGDDGQDDVAPLEVVKDDEVVLAPLDVGLESSELLMASLVWDQGGSGRCLVQSGLQVDDALAQFLRVEGILDVYAVFPWELSFPKDVDPLDVLEPIVEHKFYLRDNELKLTVKFSYSDTVITLHGVEQEVEGE